MKKVVNRRAHFEYQLLERFEAGIVLTGAEVKSVRNGRIQLDQAYVRLVDREAYLINALIHPYLPANNSDYQATKTRKLLLHKSELLKLAQKISQKGLTMVPVSCYTRHHKVKLEIALAKGKKGYQKREALRKKAIQQQVETELRAKGM